MARRRAAGMEDAAVPMPAAAAALRALVPSAAAEPRGSTGPAQGGKGGGVPQQPPRGLLLPPHTGGCGACSILSIARPCPPPSSPSPSPGPAVIGRLGGGGVGGGGGAEMRRRPRPRGILQPSKGQGACAGGHGRCSQARLQAASQGGARAVPGPPGGSLLAARPCNMQGDGSECRRMRPALGSRGGGAVANAWRSHGQDRSG